jgi:PAS domain S-box-containing protein
MAPLDVNDPNSLPLAVRFLAGGGEATRLILQRDWSGHSLGDPSGWPEGLKATLSTVLNSPESMILCWGRDELTFFFNEAYFPLLGPRLAWAIGAPFQEVWFDAWEQAKPIIDDAFGGRSQRFTDLPWKLDTDRGVADTWFTFSYSRILDAGGEVAGLFIFTNETTARVLADAALERSQADLRALNATLERQVVERTVERDRMWDTSPDLMAIIDFHGVFRRVNPAWTVLLGYQRDELVEHHVNEFVLAPDHEDTVAAYEASARGATLRVENRYRHKDGSTRWISWVAAPAGELTYATGRDVTAEKARDAELEKAQDALRQAQKMEAVGQLTGGLAHDFNNLLTGMMGNLELLQHRVARGRLEDLDRFILAAQGAGRRAASLTQRLLAFSRRQTLDPRPTDVNRLIAGMEDMLRRTIGPANTLEVVGAGGLWPANIDAGQLENALLNLCINARDAMPDGGRLTIETANKWLDDRGARERDLAPGQYLSICVSDTGTGMDQQTIERVFEPFFTTKPIGQGTGLGLSMIYGFARQSGGQVRIYSEVGLGTTMCIYLPRYLGDAVDERGETVAALPEGGSGTILIVDDEATIRHLVGEVLDEVGYTVIGAADGAAGVKVLQSGARVDLLITDVGLPNGMNGRQVADAARALRPGLKVLFITGYAENAAVGNGHLEPGMELLTKPFSLDALIGKVNEMMT